MSNNDPEIIPGSPNDPDNPQKALAALQKRIKASSVRGTVEKIPRDRTKFVCPNHPVKMVINMSDSSQRSKENKMEEFECSCGVTYIKS
jgi:hypothetical protein